ncbi:DNA -binding domain-containing protein [Bradyrhizobium pachyrhizi]|uniref:DNA -binding domain-containing protein n=1 Tax=Bradyrhizobium pachyrhizi TaxID=280333 RepID=UPI00067E3AD9|nr:DUF2285 domain-containing protein [Bradyrhizobium pachyrhizi]
MSQGSPSKSNIADIAPDVMEVTQYDIEQWVTYCRVLDADAEGADWREVTQIVLHRDPQAEPERARRAHESHLTRARWLARTGYRKLLRGNIKH